jgi:hypothetical protein
MEYIFYQTNARLGGGFGKKERHWEVDLETSFSGLLYSIRLRQEGDD